MSLTWTPATHDDPEFTVTTASQHSTLAGRSTADAHPASAITTDNDWNGNLTSAGTNLAAVLDAIDDLALGGGGGAVDSVNGETGTVVLDAADVDAVPITAVGLLAGETNRGDWSGATAYVVGDVVHDHAAGGLYVCAVANTNEQPSLTAAKWTEIDGTGRQIALAPGSSAVGALGAAFGPGAEGGGTASTATGFLASAAGAYATATGAGAEAAGIGATAVGFLASAAGDYATAVGMGATAAADGDVNLANILTGHIDTGTYLSDEAPVLPFGALDLPETADVTNPAVGSQRLVARTDGLYVRDEAGTEVGPLGAGGGAVDSVNGETGVVVLDAADVGAAPTSRTISAGTGLTGGGDLSANRTLAVSYGTTAGTAAQGNDSRLSDARTPTSHVHGAADISSGTVATARLGSGTASSATFLRGDQTWGRPGLILPAQSGQYHGLQTRAANATYHFMITITGRMALVPVFVEPGSYDALALNQTVVGTSTWRFGLYPSDPTTLLPDGLALIADLGTLNMSTTTGYRTVAASVSPTVPTLYWAGVLLDALTTAPTVHCVGGGGGAFLVDPPWTPNTMGSNITRNNITRIATGVTTGAMPATCPATSWSDFGPWLALRGA